MTKPIPLSDEERKLLKRMDTELLLFFSEAKNNKNFFKFKEFFDLFVDLRKNTFFDTSSLSYTEKQLKIDHTFKLGEMSAVRLMIRLFAASEQELSRRKEEYDKRREELKNQHG